MAPELHFQWSVAVALALAATASMVGPVLVALWWRRRSGAPMSVWGAGALVFVVSQCVLRLPWQIPLGIWMGPRIHGSRVLSFGWIAASALTAGVFEEVGRWGGYRWIVKKERSFRTGVMFGLGHGGIESMLLVGLTLFGTLATYTLVAVAPSVLKLPPETLEKLVTAMSALHPGDFTAAVVERVMALTFHVAASLLVLQCFVGGSKAWVVLAVLLHFLADFVAVGGAVELKSHGSLVAESAGLPVFFLSIGIIAWSRRRLAPAAAPS
ncbi:MAG TPA: YhfC family glutamic-type intramembrane protease [Polyangiaceae bacterium]|jgi:uncharacterized membrane protein YhfC|nr:YhfC family glutamic-type intramembrane protease [Polyangiaceae bacterium]